MVLKMAKVWVLIRNSKKKLKLMRKIGKKRSKRRPRKLKMLKPSSGLSKKERISKCLRILKLYQLKNSRGFWTC